MSRVCSVTGKSPSAGNNRPFSLKATKRRFLPNLFTKKMFNPETGKVEKMKLSAKAIKTLKKWAKDLGIDNTPAPKTAEVANSTKVRSEKAKKLTPKQKKEAMAAESAEKVAKREKAA
jgi:large subunit ribosomal protein L28